MQMQLEADSMEISCPAGLHILYNTDHMHFGVIAKPSLIQDYCMADAMKDEENCADFVDKSYIEE